MTERQFRTRQVIPFLKTLKNTVVFPIQQVSISGTPDFILCIRGWFVGLELKTDTGDLSKLQGFMSQQIIFQGGGYFCVARPSTWAANKAALTALTKGPKA